MPPRQRTTFKNKKPTTTYSYVEDRPTSASERLDTFVRSNPEGDNRNTQQASVNQVVLDMPTKFQSKFKGVNNYDDMNSAQKMIFDFYDNRNKYQRDMNNLRTSSPEMRQAYAQRFPVENFAMNMGPTIAGAMTGIPLGLLERGFDATKRGFDFAKSGAGRGLDAILSGIDTGLGAVEGGLDSLSGDTGNMIQDTGEIIKNTGGDLKDNAVDIFKDAITKREEPSTFTAQNRPINNPLEQLIIDSQSVDTPGIERIFKLPSDFKGDFNNMYFTGVPDRSLKENYLVNNPNLQSLIGMNFNQGGLASLNNRDYGMLMGASNFGF
jgi:hypothetical protein